jgi:hypothetical protein
MSEDRPPKRRKQELRVEAPPEQSKQVFLRLIASQAQQFELESTVFMRFDDLEYLRFNSRNASYLYFISSTLFEVPEQEITLYFTPKHSSLRDDDEGWEAVESDDQISVGEYLVVFESGSSISPVHHNSNLLGPNLDLQKVKPKRTNTTSIPKDPTPHTTPMPVPHQNTMLPPPSPLKQLASSMQSSPASIKSNKSTASTESKRAERDPRTRLAVLARDTACVVTGVAQDVCHCSHIIPVALLLVRFLLKGANWCRREASNWISTYLLPPQTQAYVFCSPRVLTSSLIDSWQEYAKR